MNEHESIECNGDGVFWCHSKCGEGGWECLAHVRFEKHTEAGGCIQCIDASSGNEEAALSLLRELYAIVGGECPSLINEDSGGFSDLALKIEGVLEHGR